MKYLLTALVSIMFIQGCSSSLPPNCSSDATTNTLKNMLLGDDVAKVGQYMKFENITPVRKDDAIKKIDCSAVIIAVGKETGYKMPITYATQLNENGEHIVKMNSINRIDLEMIAGAIYSNIK